MPHGAGERTSTDSASSWLKDEADCLFQRGWTGLGGKGARYLDDM